MADVQVAEGSPILVNAVLNFLNLAVSAIVLYLQRTATTQVAKNTRQTRQCSRRVITVREQINTKLAELVELLGAATSALSEEKRKAAGKARRSRSKPKRKPRPR